MCVCVCVCVCGVCTWLVNKVSKDGSSFPVLCSLPFLVPLPTIWQANFVDFISHASKVMLKILQSRLQQYMNRELPDVQAGFRKGRGTRDQIANICWIIKEQENSIKTSISALLTMPKPLTVWITINCGKF